MRKVSKIAITLRGFPAGDDVTKEIHDAVTSKELPAGTRKLIAARKLENGTRKNSPISRMDLISLSFLDANNRLIDGTSVYAFDLGLTNPQ